MPPQVAGESAAHFVAALDAAVNEREAQLVATHRASERRFLGAARARATSPEAMPKTHEPRRQRDPAVAAQDKPLRLALLARLVQFRQDHRRAWRRWRAVGRAAFPIGTYKMRDYPGVTLASSA